MCLVALTKKLVSGRWKKKTAEEVTSCLWVSELCDSESNSPAAGQVSTCDFDIAAVLNWTVSKDSSDLRDTKGRVSREKKLNWRSFLWGKERKGTWNSRIPRLPTEALKLQQSDHLIVAWWCTVGFLRGSACMERRGTWSVSRKSSDWAVVSLTQFVSFFYLQWGYFDKFTLCDTAVISAEVSYKSKTGFINWKSI